jgi:hypothetical protein
VAVGLPAPDFLPVDPVGLAVEDHVFLPVLGEPYLLAGGQVPDPQIVIADEGEILAVG